MKSAIELKTEQTNKLIKRLNFLKNSKPESREEIEFLTNMIASADVSNDVYDSRPSTINIKNSRDEEWYFQQIQQWIKRHPSSISGRAGRSSIYKFALHFFVENIVLNPENAKLTELQLAERLNDGRHDIDTKNIELKMNQLEEMTSFIMALLFKQFDYVPERVDDRSVIQFAINSMNEIGLNDNVAASEINPNEQLGKTFKMYKELRSRDKQLIKNINHRGGGGIQYD
ncbi:MAG: hypothetical protein ACLT1L_03590 [Leuconostoc lactis]|uniref:hypothetical protein n=1 Tax=Leuconostoc lactis TaxID=1246 RepID=UPI0039913373